MARTTVLGKRKAQDTPALAVETRKRRALRSSAAIVRSEENDENVAPQEIRIPSNNGPCSVLDEDFVLPDRPYGDDDTPCRRAEKRGRKAVATNSISKISGHFGITKNIVPGISEEAQLATPKTPRHRDALATSISTPKHQVRVVGRLPLTPRTPRTPGGSAITIYNSARQLFARGADNSGLVGREKERNAIKAFIEGGIWEGSGCSLYISGPPGTGKSAFTNSVVEEIKGTDGVRCAHVNCMSVRNSQDLHAKLLEELYEDDREVDEDMPTTLRRTFFPKQKSDSPMYLVILDEIDHLLTLNLETVYTLFEWALDPSSNLILVGIANALDLTDRFLPRLKAKSLKPQLLPFVPYTVPEIVAVITTKLQSLLPSDATDKKWTPFVQPPAIQLCAKKVASQTGDLRKAFDIIRRAVDIVESEVKAKHAAAATPSTPSAVRRVLGENTNMASSQQSTVTTTTANLSAKATATALANLTVLTAPRASLAHMSKVAASAFGNGTASRLKTLNLQQKAALCAMTAHTNRTANYPSLSSAFYSSPLSAASGNISGNGGFNGGYPKTPSKRHVGEYSFFSPGRSGLGGEAAKPPPAPTVRQLFATYTALVRREGALAPLTGTEFADVVGTLEGLGLVVEEKNVLATPRKSKGLGAGAREDRRVRGCVSEKEVEGCLEGVAGGLLRGLLRGEQ